MRRREGKLSGVYDVLLLKWWSGLWLFSDIYTACRQPYQEREYVHRNIMMIVSNFFRY
jgi:hypothetical protein